ncbi:hypothetical protein ACI2KH_25205, partial [Roseomonas mucosa]|uniref:hypothetical protein n=1 Tax=Roseomonas mucosa TaxID=207340 RepID=UPI00384C361A
HGPPRRTSDTLRTRRTPAAHPASAVMKRVLSHQQIAALAAARARNDTSEIDVIIVSGCYYHSDGFDGYFLWPIDIVPLNAAVPFREADFVREAWSALTDAFMTELFRPESRSKASKGPVRDTQFDVDGVTYIRPAPAIGGKSPFYIHGRPRLNGTGMKYCPPVANTFPLVTRHEWEELRRELGDDPDLCESFEEWRRTEVQAEGQSTPLAPLVRVRTPIQAWWSWYSEGNCSRTARGLFGFANHLFNVEAMRLIQGARELRPSLVVPARSMVAVTEVIGQNMANDVSHIVRLTAGTGGTSEHPLVANERMFHEHALGLGAAYAIRHSISTLLWVKDLRYAWV